MSKPRTFSGKVAIAAFVTLSVAALFLLVIFAANFFLLIFGGILFGVLLSALTDWVSGKTRLGRGWSLGLVILLMTTILVGGIWLMAPTVGEQAGQLSESLPKAIQNLQDRLSQSDVGKQILQGMPKNPQKLLSAPKDVLSQVTGIFSSTLGALANVIIVIITGIYLASNPDSYRKGFSRLFVPAFRPRLIQVLDQCYQTLSNWLLSRFITMLIVSVTTWVGLVLLGIPLSVVLAVIAGVFNFIPNLGPYIALIPALLVAFMQGPEQALYVALLYMGVQSVEGYVITPMLDKKFVSTPPALLLFGQVLLGILTGIAGILLASPLVAVALVIVGKLYVKDYQQQTNPAAET